MSKITTIFLRLLIIINLIVAGLYMHKRILINGILDEFIEDRRTLIIQNADLTICKSLNDEKRIMLISSMKELFDQNLIGSKLEKLNKTLGFNELSKNEIGELPWYNRELMSLGIIDNVVTPRGCGFDRMKLGLAVNCKYHSEKVEVNYMIYDNQIMEGVVSINNEIIFYDKKWDGFVIEKEHLLGDTLTLTNLKGTKFKMLVDYRKWNYFN